MSPYLLLKNSIANAISAQVENSLELWAKSWDLPVENTASCVPASQYKADFFLNAHWGQRHLQNGSTVWFHIPETLARGLEQSVFGLDKADATVERNKSASFAGKVIVEALDELIDKIITAICQLEIQPESAVFSPPTHLFKRGSGAVICEISIGANVLRVLLPAAAIPQIGKTQTARSKLGLTSLHEALKKTPVNLHVEVSDAELTLGYLSTLAIGDVLKLPNKLDQTLRVMTADHITVCNAHLGSSAGSLAIEVVKPH
ncbi:FliM/FliN family flagellar motor switch protein [Undibacterium sp. Di26W]